MLWCWLAKALLSFEFFDNLEFSDSVYSAISNVKSIINSFSMIFDFGLFFNLFLSVLFYSFLGLVLRLVLKLFGR